MLPTVTLRSLVSVLLITLPTSNAQNNSTYDKVTDPKKRAEYALSTLQIWYNTGTGLWDTTGWWNSANAMTMLGDFAKAEPDNKQLQSLAARVFANTVVQAPSSNPQPGIEDQASSNKSADFRNQTFALYNKIGSGYAKTVDLSNYEPHTTFPLNWRKPMGSYVDVTTLSTYASSKDGSQVTLAATPNPAEWLDGFYDDDLWWALGWINAYDVTNNTQYLTLAEGIFAAVTRAWPTRCGNGGIFWSWEKEYMNAIANELFLSTAAHLANRVKAERKKKYVEWAIRTLTWFLQSGMINERGTINDGLTESCTNNGQTTWSYNQGVILGGLVELNNASPNKTYLELASRIAKAAIVELSDANGVIHDVCEPGCGADGTQFKGIFMRNLQKLHEAAPDTKYAKAIQINANSIWLNNRDEMTGNTFSVNWAGPFVRPANASTHSSAMDALVAAITAG